MAVGKQQLDDAGDPGVAGADGHDGGGEGLGADGAGGADSGAEGLDVGGAGGLDGRTGGLVVGGAEERRTGRVRRFGRRRSGWLESTAAAVLGCLVLVVHDVPYLLRVPFWLDESWVAMSTRVPLGDLIRVTGPTPVGWTLLLRLVPGDGEQRYRLLPLLFAALTVAAAYLLGRELRMIPVLTGLLTAAAALLVPALLVRDDLKQYTADAFVTVLIMLLVARVESAWSRRRLALLGVAAVAGMLVSDTTIFVGAAGLIALAAAEAAGRRWARLRDTVVAGTATAAGMGLVYLTLVRPHELPSLRSYWQAYYLSTGHGPRALGRDVLHRVAGIMPALGFGRTLLCALFVLLGIGTLALRRRRASALLVPLAGVALLLAALAGRYPFLDPRTSTFLCVAVVLLAAIGVAGAAWLLAQRTVLAGVALAAAAIAGYAVAVAPQLRVQSIPVEDVRSQVRYVDAHRRPGDVVIVNYGAGWSFAYYERGLSARVLPATEVGPGFLPGYPPSSGVVLVPDFTPATISAGVVAARRLAGGGRLWVVRGHLEPAEDQAWQAALGQRGRQPVPVPFLLLSAR